MGVEPMPQPPCRGIYLKADDQRIPLNYQQVNTIQLWEFDGEEGHPAPADDLSSLASPITIFKLIRLGEGPSPFSVEPAPFDFGPVTAGSTSRALILRNATPGEYLVHWAEETCQPHPRLPAVPASAGKEVGRFTLLPASPLPPALGNLTEASRSIEERSNGYFSTKIGIDLALPKEAKPWVDLIEIAMFMDDKQVTYFSKLSRSFSWKDGVQVIGDVAPYTFRYRCTSTGYPLEIDNHDRDIPKESLTIGNHRIKLVGRMPLLSQDQQPATLETQNITFDLRCDSKLPYAARPSDDTAATDAGPAGCTIEGPFGRSRNAPALPIVFVSLAVLVARLLGRRRSRLGHQR